MFLRKILTAFLMSFLRMVLVIGNRCENKSDIELFDPNDHSKFKCWPVPTCQEGQQPSVEPGSKHPKTTAVSCIPCDPGWFSNHDTNYKCHKCTSCGNKDVLVNCSIYRDAVCSKSCKSKTHYFNESDGQCYSCTECCGKDKENIEPQCLLYSGNLYVGLVIGQQGELHCKALSSQNCDEPLENESTNVSSIIDSNNGVLERNCSMPENNVTLPSTDSYRSTSKEGATSRCHWNSLPHILLICGSILVAVILLFLFIRERNRRFSRNGYQYLSSLVSCCPCMHSCFPGLSGRGCSADCERAILEKKTFEEELKCIPDGVKIDDIDYEVESIIVSGLDENKAQAKNWYDVGRKLGLSRSDLNHIKREDLRQEGSPTKALIDKLSTLESVVTVRCFVHALHYLGRHDIVNPIFDFYRSHERTSPV